MAQVSLVIGAATRPHPHETENGDAWLVTWHEGRCRLAVIDGLGHGPMAARAAAVAVDTLRAQPHLGPAESLRACHRALPGTRGAVIAVAVVDAAAMRLTFAGVGNVEARLWTGERQERPISYRGVLGAALPTVREFEFHLGQDWLLLMHSDGIRSRVELIELAAFRERQPQALADTIVAQWGREQDDATVLVACAAR